MRPTALLSVAHILSTADKYNSNTIPMLSLEKNKRNSARDISFELVTLPLALYFVVGILVIECLSVVYSFNN